MGRQALIEVVGPDFTEQTILAFVDQFEFLGKLPGRVAQERLKAREGLAIQIDFQVALIPFKSCNRLEEQRILESDIAREAGSVKLQAFGFVDVVVARIGIAFRGVHVKVGLTDAVGAGGPNILCMDSVSEIHEIAIEIPRSGISASQVRPI